jgi:hypothetical protein
VTIFGVRAFKEIKLTDAIRWALIQITDVLLRE